MGAITPVPGDLTLSHRCTCRQNINAHKNNRYNLKNKLLLSVQLSGREPAEHVKGLVFNPESHEKANMNEWYCAYLRYKTQCQGPQRMKGYGSEEASISIMY